MRSHRQTLEYCYYAETENHEELYFEGEDVSVKVN
jgi:hypothetical protein